MVPHPGLSWPILPVLVAAGWVQLFIAAQLLDPVVTSPGWRLALIGGVVLCALAATALTWWLHRTRGPQLAADALVVATASVVSGATTMALHGTRWGMTGLAGDASFRTEAATRYAHTVHLQDYAYRDLPAYYPPALGWAQGQLARLLEVPPWAMMKPTQIVLAALVPLIAYWMWSRVLAPLPAAFVVAASTMLSIDLQKPDEWLVLVCVVPWWMDLVTGTRRPDKRDWAGWQHGLFGGAVLLTHTFYLLPLAVASALWLGAAAARRRRPELSVRRALGVVAIGLVVASAYWVPIVLARFNGAPSDNLQMRYTYPGANIPPFPLPVDAPGVLGIVGLVWLCWCAVRWRRDRRFDQLAAAIAVLLAGAYATMIAGGIGIRLGVGLLTFKTDEVVILGQITAGILGLAALARHSRQRAHPSWAHPIAAALCLILAAAAGLQYAGWWVVGDPTRSAATTRYPSGAFPDSQQAQPAKTPPAFVRPGDPSVDDVRAAWHRASGRPMSPGVVLVTSRTDLLATTPVHPFTSWKSIYSNPLGQFGSRIDLLRQVTACQNSQCAARLLRGNPFDRVDGLILERSGNELSMPVLVDDFPNRSRTTAITFTATVFDGTQFTRTDTGRLAVIVLHP